MSNIDIGRDFLEHLDFSTAKRAALASKGQALPGGGFPIRNVADLKRAIQAYGRAKNKAAAKAWIIKRAKALDAVDILPEGWVTTETQQSNFISEFLSHHGVKGQKWGRRRSRKQLAAAAKGKSVKDLSDQELQSAVSRMNLEQQYSRLSSGRNRSIVGVGSAFVGSIAVGVLRNQIQGEANRRIGSALAARAARAAAAKAAGK
jgi:hypothetical protein